MRGEAVSDPAIETLRDRAAALPPVERAAMLWDECMRLRSALNLIAANGGRHNEEIGLSCNGGWCADQARTALEEKP